VLGKWESGQPGNEVVLLKKRIQKIVRYTLISLPLAGVVVADFMPLTARAQQFLVMIVLIWLQVFFIFEVFLMSR
jgi:hypothetical protein